MKDITSSLSLVRHSNDSGKSSSKFFCKSRYCRFLHSPSSEGSTDSVLQLRFKSVMRLASLFNLQYSMMQCLIFSIWWTILDHIKNKDIRKELNIQSDTPLLDMMIRWTYISLEKSLKTVSSVLKKNQAKIRTKELLMTENVLLPLPYIQIFYSAPSSRTPIIYILP